MVTVKDLFHNVSCCLAIVVPELTPGTCTAEGAEGERVTLDGDGLPPGRGGACVGPPQRDMVGMGRIGYWVVQWWSEAGVAYCRREFTWSRDPIIVLMLRRVAAWMCIGQSMAGQPLRLV